MRSLDDQERVAALKRDIPALERLWSDQFVVNAPDNRVVVGRDGVPVAEEPKVRSSKNRGRPGLLARDRCMG